MRPRVAVTLVAAAVVVALSPGDAHGQTLEIHHLDVGQGDSVLVLGPNSRGLLIDCGSVKRCRPDDPGGPGRTVDDIAVLLNGNDYYMLATHYHLDHIGWLDEVIGAVGQPLVAFDRGGTYSSGAFDDYRAAVEAPMNVRQTIVLGDMYAQGLDLGAGVSVTCVVVEGSIIGGGHVSPGSDENAKSIGIVISYGGFDYLAAGDLQDTIEPSLGASLRDPALAFQDVDVAKVDHHGSDTSSEWGFLLDVAAECAVCSTGSHATYRHPRKTAYQRIHDAGSYIYQTCAGCDDPLAYIEPPIGWGDLVDGPVTVTTDGTVFSVTWNASGELDYYRVDDIFRNGFESGNTTAWSS